MVQQLNLYRPSLRPQRQRFDAQTALLLLVVATLLCLGAGLALQQLTLRSQARSAALNAQLLQAEQGLQAQRTAAQSSPMQAELQRLQSAEQAQQRLAQTVVSGRAGSLEGPAELLQALARQAQSTVWITGLTVNAEDQSLELRGRMIEASQLPGYLRRLEQEPRFKGRVFAKLQLQSLELPQSGGTVTEFTLQSAIKAAPKAPSKAVATAGVKP